MRTIDIVTVGRSDFGIYLPVIEEIQQDPTLRPRLIVSGAHLSPEFGRTADAIPGDFEVRDRVNLALTSDSPEGIARSIGLGITGFAQVLARSRPDILLVLGDRFEMYAAVVAALPFAIPIAHIHGGESTEGLIDEALRHSITKMSHLHFVSTETYAKRVIQMGEEPWRVVVSGAPALDAIRRCQFLGREELAATYGVTVTDRALLVTYHPVTLEYERVERHVDELLAALQQWDGPIVFTYPNADTRSQVIIDRIREFVAGYPNAKLIVNLGSRAYFSFMRHVAAMVGNSSSGIIEAASLGLPVVNVGNRQRGRVRGENVIDTDESRGGIIEGIRKATAPAFRARLQGMTNPYGDGHAAARIVDRLRSVPLDERLLLKRFCDLPAVV